jgi:hypothetical protein
VDVIADDHQDLAGQTMSTPMNNAERHSGHEKWVAWALRGGAYISFTLLLITAVAALLHSPAAAMLARVGILCLLATPLVRIVTALWMYAVEKDRRMVVISATVLAILVVSSVLGVELK